MGPQHMELGGHNTAHNRSQALLPRSTHGNSSLLSYHVRLTRLLASVRQWGPCGPTRDGSQTGQKCGLQVTLSAVRPS